MGSNMTTRILGSFLVILLGIAGYFGYRISSDRPIVPDQRLLDALVEIAAVHSYTQEVKTVAEFPSRRLEISGIYLVDRAAGSYDSLATTTLILEDQKQRVSFTLHNISIGADVYTRVESGDEALETTIPLGTEWHHFRSNSIPEEYIGISIPGPILDNLRILSEEGRYVHLIQPPEEESGRYRYIFELSGETPPPPGGNLQALIDRIGDGTISVWITASSTVEQLVFDAATYHSTTSVSRINDRLDIAAPTI